MTKRPTKTFVTHGVVAFVNSPLCEHARKKKKMLGRKNEGFSFSQEKKKERKWIQSQSVNGSRNDTASTSNIELNPSIPAKICDRAENQQLEMKLVAAAEWQSTVVKCWQK